MSIFRSTRASIAVDIATEAGNIAKHWFDSAHYRVDAKSDGSPVTQADLEVETYMRTALREHFPDDGVLGEEFGDSPGSTGYRWILDPIDGTKSFVRSVPLYANLIALERDGEILFGAINLPSAGVLIHASGAAAAGATACPAGSPGTTPGRRARHGDVAGGLAARHHQRTDQPGVVLRTWGDAYGYAMVASGHADAVSTTPRGSTTSRHASDHRRGRRAGSQPRRRAQLPARHRGASNGILHDSVLKLVNQAI